MVLNIVVLCVSILTLRGCLSVYLVIGIVLLALGLFMLLRPSDFFDLTQSWKSDTPGEPSKLFLFSTRLGGCLCTLVGLAGIFLGIYQLL